MPNVQKFLITLLSSVIVTLLNSVLVWAAVHLRKKEVKDTSFLGALAVSVYFGILAFILGFFNLGLITPVILAAVMYFVLAKYHNKSFKDVFSLWIIWFGLFLLLSLLLALFAYSTNLILYPGLF